MTYEETVDYILDIPFFAKKIGTENLAGLLERLGNPEKSSKIIHVAGTNGKGSTCSFLSSMLQAAGYRVGLFTSPHLVSINERIRINDKPISNLDFVKCFDRVREKFTEHPSFFEVVFAMAAVYFKEENVDYAIYETGMGGRYDATNVVYPEISIITSVGMDHMQYLGNSIEEIAFQKAGIIKPGIPVVYFKRDEAAAHVIRKQAEKYASPLIEVEKCQYIINVLGDKTIDFSLHNRYYSYDHLRIPKTSLYQVENACLAVTALVYMMERQQVKGSYQNIINQGLMNFSWEGRMEELSPGIYVDGAHNTEAIKSYCHTMTVLHAHKKKILVFAAVKDKDYGAMIEMLCHSIDFENIIVTSVDSVRKASVAEIAEVFGRYTDGKIFTDENISDAMNRAVRLRAESGYENRPDIYCVGSLYLVGGIKKWLDTADLEEIG